MRNLSITAVFLSGPATGATLGQNGIVNVLDLFACARRVELMLVADRALRKKT